MENRRYSSEALYPFAPSAELYRSYLRGLLDCFIVVRGPVDAATPSSSVPLVRLVSIEGTALTNTYTFQALREDGVRPIVFSMNKGSGIVRVTTGFSMLIVNSSDMFDGIGLFDVIADLEPGRVCWQIDEVTTIRLVNEERKYDPGTRTDLANTVIRTFDSDGDTVVLENGYNCELSYNESTETLYINAAAGLGKGLPDTIPWDNDAPDVDSGIRTINGINANGNVNIIPGSSITRAQ